MLYEVLGVETMKRKAAPKPSGHALTCYCLRCRSNVEMINPVKTIKGSVAYTQGQCGVCGAGTSRIGSAKEGEH